MRPFVLILTAAAFLALASPAHATTFLARQGEDWVRLTDAPCASAQVRAQILPAEVPEWHAATAMFQGHSFEACWREVRGAAYVVYEDGDRGVVPMRDAKPVPEA